MTYQQNTEALKDLIGPWVAHTCLLSPRIRLFAMIKIYFVHARSALRNIVPNRKTSIS